jgi:hypothetical protein
MSWEYRVTIEATIWTRERVSEPEAEQAAVDAISREPEGVTYFHRKTLSVKERRLSKTSLAP